MRNEVDEILKKFEIKLKNFEIDKAFGQITPDSIYSIWPSEMTTLIDYIKYLREDNRRLRQKLTILSIRPEFSVSPEKVNIERSNVMNESGIYFRAFKNNKWQSVLLEQLPDEYIDEYLAKYDKPQLMVCIKELAHALKYYQDNDEDFEE